MAVMHMWRPFRSSVGKNPPNPSIVFDKFHIMRHLSEEFLKLKIIASFLPPLPENARLRPQ
ncbi:transposase [Xanthomonas campestris pv. badrii]|uniref:Transposase n=2 Tax=Xanthomonas campestris TaxID=339 RepID=A0A7Z2V840_XANCA|nr:transposase [Xanthomonas campestris pv. badrii]